MALEEEQEQATSMEEMVGHTAVAAVEGDVDVDEKAVAVLLRQQVQQISKSHDTSAAAAFSSKLLTQSSQTELVTSSQNGI